MKLIDAFRDLTWPHLKTVYLSNTKRDLVSLQAYSSISHPVWPALLMWRRVKEDVEGDVRDMFKGTPHSICRRWKKKKGTAAYLADIRTEYSNGVWGNGVRSPLIL